MNALTDDLMRVDLPRFGATDTPTEALQVIFGAEALHAFGHGLDLPTLHGSGPDLVSAAVHRNGSWWAITVDPGPWAKNPTPWWRFHRLGEQLADDPVNGQDIPALIAALITYDDGRPSLDGCSIHALLAARLFTDLAADQQSAVEGLLAVGDATALPRLHQARLLVANAADAGTAANNLVDTVLHLDRYTGHDATTPEGHPLTRDNVAPLMQHHMPRLLTDFSTDQWPTVTRQIAVDIVVLPRLLRVGSRVRHTLTGQEGTVVHIDHHLGPRTVSVDFGHPTPTILSMDLSPLHLLDPPPGIAAAIARYIRTGKGMRALAV